MLVFAFQGLPCWHQKSIQKVCSSKTPSWTRYFEFNVDIIRKWLICGPFKIQWAPKWYSRSTTRRQNVESSRKPQRLVTELRPRSICCCILASLLLTFGTLLIRIWVPKWYPKSTCGAKIVFQTHKPQIFGFWFFFGGGTRKNINQHKHKSANIKQHISIYINKTRPLEQVDICRWLRKHLNK